MEMMLQEVNNYYLQQLFMMRICFNLIDLLILKAYPLNTSKNKAIKELEVWIIKDINILRRNCYNEYIVIIKSKVFYTQVFSFIKAHSFCSYYFNGDVLLLFKSLLCKK